MLKAVIPIDAEKRMKSQSKTRRMMLMSLSLTLYAQEFTLPGTLKREDYNDSCSPAGIFEEHPRSKRTPF